MDHFRKQWPSTSYMKAIDIWTSGCYLVVFICKLEYCTILYLTKRSDWEVKARSIKKAKSQKKANHAGNNNFKDNLRKRMRTLKKEDFEIQLAFGDSEVSVFLTFFLLR